MDQRLLRAFRKRRVIGRHLGNRSQRRGVTELADERGYVAALFGERE